MEHDEAQDLRRNSFTADQLLEEILQPVAIEDYSPMKQALLRNNRLEQDEMISRYNVHVYCERLYAKVAEANSPEDFQAITDAYTYMKLSSLEGTDTEAEAMYSFSPLLISMFERTGQLLRDDETGTANVNAVADFMLPAVEQYITHPELITLHSESDYKLTVGHYISQQLFRLERGTAEFVGALRLREKLHAVGYTGFGAI